MTLTDADIGIQLLMNSTVNLQEIEARIRARVFAGVQDPVRGPAMRAVLQQPLAALDATSPASPSGSGRRFTCLQIGSHTRGQELLQQGQTYLDKNGDGVACESLR